jgi:hypothetical protein
MSYEKKCDLIRNDPVTCVRYFEHRLKCLWEILSAPYGPFQGYELEDKYVRVEFQVRGSPHIHALLWLKNASKYDKDKSELIERCTEFIDKLISVNSKPTEFSEDLISLQHHKHSHTCKKHVNGCIICRFGIPYFPMRKTMILEPFFHLSLQLHFITYACIAKNGISPPNRDTFHMKLLHVVLYLFI